MLYEVITLLQDLDREIPRAGESSQEPSGSSEVPAVNRAEKLCPENRHIFGVTGADKKVAFIGTGSATHTHVQK